MKATSTLSKIIVSMGFQNPMEFLLKYVLPFFSGIIVAFTLLTILVPQFPRMFSLILLFGGLGTMFLYPLIVFEKKKIEIDRNMHLFITFAGSISTLDIQRNILFKKIAEKEAFGELSFVAKRILYLAKSWNLGFAAACRKIGVLNPSKLLGDFLDRFAIMMDFGQSLQVFLGDEQISVMDDYAVEYKQSLERIKTTQEIFLSLTMAMAFMMSIGLLLPLIASSDINTVIYWILAAIVGIDLLVVMFVYNFIPSDPLCHTLHIKSKGVQQLEKVVYFGIPLFSILLITLTILNLSSFIISFSIAMIPLFIVGILAQNEEEIVYKRDKSYPPFIRAIGSGIEVRQGAIISSLYALQVHDFGPLNEMVISLYRRLRTGNNKMICWEYFGAESGSNLIVQFTNIFAESVSLGGSAQKIGEIISINFQKLLSLRKLRIQLASALRGSLYGAMVGFSMSAYVAAQVTQLLSSILSQPSGSTEDGLAGTLSEIAATGQFVFDLDRILFIIGLMIIVHAFASGIIIKIIEGGHPFAALFDICILLWLGAAMGIILPIALESLLPGLGQTFGIS